VRKAARKDKKVRFTALLHHLTVDRLRESFYALKRKAAPGVDGITWQEYEPDLQEHLIGLHNRVHCGTYRAKPSRRVYIEKADGRQRPLGVAALEDKIVQQTVVTILNQIYEEDFLGFSYGFRPGRSQHQALDALSYALQYKKVSYVLDADIRGFFDARMHDATPDTGAWLRAVVQGHFNYYAVPGNLGSLGMFQERVLSMWWHVLCRRSQKRGVTWERMIAIAKPWLPSPRVLHPYPAQRFAANHPR